jgi:hypothetical protein
VLNLQVPAPVVDGVKLRLRHRCFVAEAHPALSIVCRAEGKIIDEWTCTVASPTIVRTFHVPPALVGPDGKITLEFKLSKPVSPAELGESPDTRTLGMGVEWIGLVTKPQTTAKS